MPTPTDLIISEYVEGSSDNKAIELYNGTGADIDLAALGYVLQGYQNGSPSVGYTVTLTGVIATGATYVIVGNQGSGTVSPTLVALANQRGGLQFNGDDAIVLRKGGAGGTVVDSFGDVGLDPGTAYGAAPTSSLNTTLRRQSDVTSGDTNISDDFNPATEYDGFAQDNFSGLGSHTIDTGGGGGTTYSIAPLSADKVEGNGGGTTAFTFTVTRSSGAGAATVDFAVTGIGGAGQAQASDFATTTGQVAFADAATTATVTVQVNADAVVEGDETFSVTITAPAGATVTGGAAAGQIDNDDVPATVLISQVQGAGGVSPLNGQIVTVEAVVTGDFQNGDADTRRNLGGFFLQEEATDGDGNAATSEGIFVYEGTGASALGTLAVGTRVRVTGTVSEFNGSTQLTAPSITVLGTGAIGEVEVATLDLPGGDRESLEHMLVTVPQRVVITEQFDLDRYGEIRVYATEDDGLAGAVDEFTDGRPYQFTQTNAPDGAGLAAHNAAVNSRTIILDDGTNVENSPITNPDGGGAYSTATAPQMGDGIAGLTGVLDFGFSNFRIRSTVDGENDFVDANPREQAPEPVGGSLKVASLNVLNFFVTLDAGANTIDNGEDPRGANNQAELNRQVQKLVTAIVEIDADVLSLIELENDFNAGNFSGVDPESGGAAIAYLVEQINARLGGPVYSYVTPPTNPDGSVGGDAIAVGFIYKDASVAIAGGTDVAVDLAAVNNRPTMAVTFEELATGGQFTAVANHLKSKSATGASGANLDQGDGQGAFNAQREAQATRLLDFVATAPTGTADTDYVLLGDFNSYFNEDPITILRDGGFTVAGGPTSYSYTFDGRIGSLDHILYSGSLAGQVTGSTKWHINSDEADALDYNLDFGRDPAIFDGTEPFKTSDHDPILLGLDLTPTPIVGTNGPETLDGRNGDDDISGLGGDDTLNGGQGDDDLDGGTGADAMNGGQGDDEYVVDDAGDTVIEAPDEGEDSVTASVTFTLLDNVENLTLAAGFGGIDGTGNALDNVLTGNEGNNTFLGLGGNDTALGGAGKDQLFGGADNDTLSGEAGRDLLDGGDGDDLLNGGADLDTINGGDGNDLLVGEGGDDRLDGGTRTDVLRGGAGADSLTGGSGGDTFDFDAIGDSTVAATGRDIIRDFRTAQGDRIDLSGIDSGDVDGAFDFTAGGRFTGVAGQLIVTVNGGNSLVQADVTGDGRADFAIVVQGVTGLTEASFVL